MKHSNRDTARKDRKATGCNHPYPDLQWPEEPTPKRDGKGWLWHCTCKRCGAAVFRAAREPGADQYGLQPHMRAKVDAAWAEFAEGEDMRRQRDRTALLQRLSQAHRLHGIRVLFPPAKGGRPGAGGHGCAPLGTEETGAESAPLSNRAQPCPPAVVPRPRPGWHRWLHDKGMSLRRAREYVVVGAWLQDPASEAFRAAVKRPDARPGQGLKRWSEVLVEAQRWRQDTEAQRVVEAAEREVARCESWATQFRRVSDGHEAAGRTAEAAWMQETVDDKERELAVARDLLRYAIHRRDRQPQPVEPGVVKVRLRGDGPEEATKQVAQALRPVLSRYGLAASVILQAAEASGD